MDLSDVFDLDLRVLNIFGLAPFKFSKGTRQIVTRPLDNCSFIGGLIIIGIGSFLVIAISPLVEYFFNVETGLLQVEDAGSVIITGRSLQLSSALSSYILLLIFSVVKKQSHIRLLNRLFSADKELQMTFSVNIKYEQEKKILNFLLLSLVLFIYISACSLIVYICIMRNNLLPDNHIPIYVANICSTPFHTFHYLIVCRTIASRLRIIEGLAKTVLNKEQSDNLITLNKDFRECVKSLNEAHGVSQLFNIVNDSIILTINSFNLIYVVFSPKGHRFLHGALAGVGFWITLHLSKVVLVAIQGENIKNQVNETNKALLENVFRRYKGKEIELLSGCPLDKLYGFQLKCTAGDFFDIDNSMLLLLFSTILSYLVILLQFQLDENNS